MIREGKGSKFKEKGRKADSIKGFREINRNHADIGFRVEGMSDIVKDCSKG